MIERDRGVLWHPYSSLIGPAPYAVTAADGVRLTLSSASGEHFDAVDGMSSWWSAIHGYRNPVLDEALRAQMSGFCHVMFGGLTHEPAVRLAELLVHLSPSGLEHVFFADSGSVSVEVALKMSVQYQSAVGHRGRSRFIALRGGYHGDTVAAMSVCDPVDGMHAAFPSLVPTQLFLPRPPAARWTGEGSRADTAAIDRWTAIARDLVARHQHEVAALIVEPVLQGAGGMHMYPPECLRTLRELADEFGLLLIFDEIATGFARTGRMFAAEWAGVVPDIMCVGKALTGGYLTLAAVLCTAAVGTAISRSEIGALLHGPTFMANPLACAVALASVQLLGHDWPRRVGMINAELETSLAPARELASVRDVRVIGAVGVVELGTAVDVQAVTLAALRAGVWLRPFRNLVYTMPPYICSQSDVGAIGHAITDAVAQVHG